MAAKCDVQQRMLWGGLSKQGPSMKVKGKGGGRQEEKRRRRKRRKKDRRGETKDEGASNAVEKLTETWQAICHSMVAHACNSNKLRQQDCCELESGIQSEFQASQSYTARS